MAGGDQLRAWLSDLCARHAFDVAAVYRRSGEHPWPLEASDEADLEAKLAGGGHIRDGAMTERFDTNELVPQPGWRVERASSAGPALRRCGLPECNRKTWRVIAVLWAEGTGPDATTHGSREP